MPRTLRNLIVASGNAGTAGQSFRNHVTGSASGVKMSDYNIGAPSYTNQPAGGPYNDNTTFPINMTLNVHGSRAGSIQRAMDNPANFGVGASGGSGAGATIESCSYVSPTETNVNIRVRSAYKTGITFSGVPTYANAPSVSSTAEEPVLITGTVTNPSTGPTTNLVISFNYIPDNGPFNPTIGNGSGFSASFYDRDISASDYDWEWYLTATDRTNETNVFSTAQSFVIETQIPPLNQTGGTLPYDTFTLYPRIRPVGGVGAWTNLANMVWLDFSTTYGRI